MCLYVCVHVCIYADIHTCTHAHACLRVLRSEVIGSDDAGRRGEWGFGSRGTARGQWACERDSVTDAAADPEGETGRGGCSHRDVQVRCQRRAPGAYVTPILASVTPIVHSGTLLGASLEHLLSSSPTSEPPEGAGAGHFLLTGPGGRRPLPGAVGAGGRWPRGRPLPGHEGRRDGASVAFCLLLLFILKNILISEREGEREGGRHP